jgi:hypothetical protein
MEELQTLRTFMEQGRYTEALDLIGEMEEMSRDDKINKVFSYAEILLIHLIKQHAEGRITRSSNASIRNSVYKINYINKRRSAGGYYLNDKELARAVHDAWEPALLRASVEAFEGRYDDAELAGIVDQAAVESEAMEMIRREKRH